MPSDSFDGPHLTSTCVAPGQKHPVTGHLGSFTAIEPEPKTAIKEYEKDYQVPHSWVFSFFT